jgi:hypothetical protein
MTAGHEMRASDADRQRTVEALQRHTAAGRLDLDEFADRVDRALACRTHADLAALVGDLPVEPAAAGSTAEETGARHLVIAFIVAMAVLVFLGVVLVLFH